jgi:hypothetical protein
MMSANGSPAARSGFVTGLAWTFIILAAFSTLITILQNIMITLMFPIDEMRAGAREAEAAGQLPALFRFMFENFHLFFAAMLALSLVSLVAAIGLLKRKNWARLAFIGIMGLGVLWNLGSLAIPFVMPSFGLEPPPGPDDAFAENFKLMWNIMIGFTVVVGLAFAGLFAWTMKRLMSPDIKREFLPE